MSELKPCKYCGEIPYVYSDYSSEKDKTFWQICCLNPECPGAVINRAWGSSIVSTCWCSSEAKAYEIWNKRMEG